MRWAQWQARVSEAGASGLGNGATRTVSALLVSFSRRVSLMTTWCTWRRLESPTTIGPSHLKPPSWYVVRNWVLVVRVAVQVLGLSGRTATGHMALSILLLQLYISLPLWPSCAGGKRRKAA